MVMLAGLLIFSWVIGKLTFAVRFLWRGRKFLLLVQALACLAASFGLLSGDINVFSVLLTLGAIITAFNFMRVVEQRMNEFYLLKAARRTGFAMIILQILAGALWLGWRQLPNQAGAEHWALVSWLGLSLAIAVVVLVSTVWNILKSRPRLPGGNFVARMPSLSVCIPARNETDDLQACLESLVASDYPKLEIIVLDDCSQTRRTPEIIRSFAHAGVQFIAGTEPAPHWLAKNWAYEQLLSAASGELVLFCGVDTRFEPASLRNIVAALQVGKNRMICVVPERTDRQYFSLIQPMRYFWELGLPRWLFKRPPVLSTCWVAGRQNLLKLGGFSAIARSIVPEAYFARRFALANKYAFVRGLNVLGVSTRKTIKEQRATALRTRYPQLHRRPEWVLLFVLTEAALLIAPFVFFIAGFSQPDKIFLILSAVTCGLLICAYEKAVMSIISPSAFFGVIAFPLVILADIVRLVASMYKYEFSVVEWKNRNVCIPAMHVYPSLPKIPKA